MRISDLIAVAGIVLAPSICAADEPIVRPILFNVDGMLRAYAPDGRLTAEFDNDLAPSWSPDGDKFVMLVPNGPLDPAIIEVGVSGHYIFEEPDGASHLYRPIWSPDGRSIALIRHTQAGFSFVVVEVSRGVVVAEGQIPPRFVANFPFYTATVDSFAWSPDSKTLMLSWGGVLLFDVEKESVRVAHEGSAVAFWLPDSTGVCLFEYDRARRPIVFQRLSRYGLGSDTKREIASADQIAATGLRPAEWLIVGAARLSPDGRLVALSMGNAETQSDAIRVYAASETCINDLSRPIQIIDTDLVPVMDWSPDSDAIAVVEQIAASGQTFGFEVRVIDVQTHDRAGLAQFELEGAQVEMLGLLGILAWSS